MASIRQGIAKFFATNKEWLATWSLAVIAIVAVVHFWPGPPSPVPQNIKHAADFVIIYPKGFTIDRTSWKYSPSDKSVQFEAKKDDIAVVFTEQKTPLAYQDDRSAYDRFVGGLRPRATFDVPLGTVSVANFIAAGDYRAFGETGILNSKGTLILAHPDRKIADDDWRYLFESLQAD